MTNQSLLGKAHSLLNWKDPMKTQPHIKSTENVSTGTGGGREKVKAPDLPMPEALSSLAVTALAIANAADTILRKGGANFGLADWALLQGLSAKPEAQLMGKLGIDLGVSRQRIQKQIDELQKAGLVSVVTTAEDKRSRLVSLTSVGHEALASTASLWSLQLAKTPMSKELKSQAMVQRRVERIAALLSRTLRSEVKEAAVAKKAAKAASSSAVK